MENTQDLAEKSIKFYSFIKKEFEELEKGLTFIREIYTALIVTAPNSEFAKSELSSLKDSIKLIEESIKLR